MPGACVNILGTLLPWRRRRIHALGETYDADIPTGQGGRCSLVLCPPAWPANDSMLAFLLLLLCAGAIYAACEYFVNGIEWLGRRLGIGETATGTVLAAFGTALPECAVTFVAVAFGASAAQKDIGVGAALGGPLALATIGYATVGLVMLLARRKRSAPPLLNADQGRLARDQGWFLSVFLLKIALGLFVFAGKPWFGLLFLAVYAVYVFLEMRRAPETEEEALEPLKLQPRSTHPAMGWICLQTLGALLVIALASHGFVIQLEALGPLLGIPAQLVSLLLSPLATELPETMNAIIWVRQGKERLALANISGAMMIQATVPSALGLFFTPWLLDTPLILAGSLTALSIGVLLWSFHRHRATARTLLCVSVFYGLFAMLILGWFMRGIGKA